LDKAEWTPLTYMDQIQNALKVLRDQGYVFGDLWPPNVMITMNRMYLCGTTHMASEWHG
jgi:hypothetical protein